MPNVRGEKRHPFSCPDTMWDWLAERGRQLGVSRSEIVRRLIRQEQERLATTRDTRVCTCVFEVQGFGVVNGHLVGPTIRDTTGCAVHGVTESGEAPAEPA
jgi:hypothetical protein